MRGDWLKIWMARQPLSTPRSTAFARPPAGHTWAPISIATSCDCASLLPPPVRCTSAGLGRPSTTGCWHAAPGAPSCCAIEDTDRERSTPENVEQILDALRWLELDWDEGPIFQTQNAERHRGGAAAAARRRPRLPHDRDRRRRQSRSRTRHGHDRGFRGEPEAEGRGAPARAGRGRDRRRRRHPRRGALSARAHGRPGDRPRGRLGPLQLRRRDRRPRRRHHARRARRGPPLEHAEAAARLRGARRSRRPRYAHLPLLHGPDGKKLSKRHGAASVQELREAGYLPEAVVNYIALLGAGFDAEEEIFPREELARRLRLERISKSPAVFDEQKLRHMNGRYAARASPLERADRADRGVHRSHRPARRRRDQPREDPDAGRLLAARRLPLRRAGRRSRRRGARRSAPTGGADALAAARESLAALDEPFDAGRPSRRRCAGSSRRAGGSRSRSSSRCASRSPARRSRPGSSRASRCWGARRRCGASTRRSGARAAAA